MTPEEIRNKMIDLFNTEPDPEYTKRFEEYHKKIKDDFQAEWSKRKFKWFFKKRRQQKLKRSIYRRYMSPIFDLVENAINEVLPKASESFFSSMVNIDDLSLGDKYYFVDEKPIDNSYSRTSFTEQLREVDDND